MKTHLKVLPGITAAILVLVGCSNKESADDHSQRAPAPADAADAGSVRIAYRGEPDPPREGDNNVRVTVAGPDGSAITDGDVSVTYYMPAMPSMNMPEMRDTFALSHEGDGTYSGPVRLSMGGTWQVTVSVSQNGQAVGKGRFTIIARE